MKYHSKKKAEAIASCPEPEKSCEPADYIKA
jgi:hypothetical protein